MGVATRMQRRVSCTRVHYIADKQHRSFHTREARKQAQHEECKPMYTYTLTCATLSAPSHICTLLHAFCMRRCMHPLMHTRHTMHTRRHTRTYYTRSCTRLRTPAYTQTHTHAHTHTHTHTRACVHTHALDRVRFGQAATRKREERNTFH